MSQLAEQSVSCAEVHPVGQQPSPTTQAVIGLLEHCAVHAAGSPVRTSAVHRFRSSQLEGQVEGGSQVSPVSTTPLPHIGTTGWLLLLSL